MVKNGKNGWDGEPNTNEPSADDCFKTCSIRSLGGKKRGYFGFASKNPGTEGSCACFLEESFCEPGTNPNLDVYRIDWESPYFTEGMFST